MEKKYETNRLILKTLGNSTEEAKMTLDFYERNKKHFKPWDFHRGEEFYELEYRKKQLDSEVEAMEEKNYLRLWIFKKSDVEFKKTIGTISVSGIIRGVFSSCRLGYFLDKDEVSKGYITEAIKRTIDIIFNEYKLHRIEAVIMPTNKSSLKVVEKLGFKNDGLLKEYLKINGNWEDHIRMILINEDIK